ncbi:hypothetical protein [Pseudoalteromonas xiamenensis]
MEWLLLTVGLVLCGVSCFYFLKANECACANAKHCKKPIDFYWIAAISSAVLALSLCCLAFHSQLGSLIWLVMMAGCFSGTSWAGVRRSKRKCQKRMTKPTNDLLTNG